MSKTGCGRIGRKIRERFNRIDNSWHKAGDHPTVVKQMIDKGIKNQNFQEQMQKQFEDEHPGKKAIWQKRMTRMFITWLKRNKKYEKYTEYAEKL